MSSDRGWTADDVPSLTGRRYIVTGANTGLGQETALVLAKKGGRVVIACRNVEKGAAARARIVGEVPGADVTVEKLDLASLASVRAFAAAERERPDPLHVLVNNAGIMAIPEMKTADGFEMQIGTNHLGHFALTALLFPKLRASDGARVVTVSSTMHRAGRLALYADPFFERSAYSRWPAYGQSKLANLLFTLELDRRLRRANLPVLAVAAHPGYAATELQGRNAQLGGSAFEGWFMNIGNSLMAQPAAAGAWPTERAATDPAAEGGAYYGPRDLFEMRGPAIRVQPNDAARDERAASDLWAWSERVTSTALEV